MEVRGKLRLALGMYGDSRSGVVTSGGGVLMYDDLPNGDCTSSAGKQAELSAVPHRILQFCPQEYHIITLSLWYHARAEADSEEADLCSLYKTDFEQIQKTQDAW